MIGIYSQSSWMFVSICSIRCSFSLQTTDTGYGRRGAYSGISVCSTLIWGESRVRQDGLQVRAWQEDVAVVRKRSRTLKLSVTVPATPS